MGKLRRWFNLWCDDKFQHKSNHLMFWTDVRRVEKKYGCMFKLQRTGQIQNLWAVSVVFYECHSNRLSVSSNSFKLGFLKKRQLQGTCHLVCYNPRIRQYSEWRGASPGVTGSLVLVPVGMKPKTRGSPSWFAAQGSVLLALLSAWQLDSCTVGLGVCSYCLIKCD